MCINIKTPFESDYLAVLLDAFPLVSSRDRPVSSGCGLPKCVALFQINKLTPKEAATCVSEFIEFLVSENCYAGLHVLFSCVEQ